MKIVRFDENVRVYIISASKSEHKSLWIQCAIDRESFQRRICSLSSILKAGSREGIFIVFFKPFLEGQ